MFDQKTYSPLLDQLARTELTLFVAGAFSQLYDDEYLPNWHIDAICTQLMAMVRGDKTRVIITMPPRTMKSFIASICLPAWILGHKPGAKIICASYNQDLAEDFAHQTRKLMQTSWYRRLFPYTHLEPKRQALNLLATTRGGYRMSTSTGGTLTGRGGDFIIIDDPIKAKDAHSEVARQGAIDWFTGTVLSRLNNPKTGRILLVAQRLHLEDLPGQLAAGGGWDELCLPLIAPRQQTIPVSDGGEITRFPGSILHPERFDEAEIDRLRHAMGERDFEAQYNQRPCAGGGTLFQLSWLRRYETRPEHYKVEAIIQSWDTAYETESHNDYSVCSTWALSGTSYYLLDIYRERLPFPELQKAVYRQREKWKADLVVVERAGSGISIFQNIRRNGGNFWITYLAPLGSKQDRASQQSPKFERGEVWIPVEAPWLRAFEDELIAFPQGKHDDQVDSVVQFLAAVDAGNLRHYLDIARRQ